MSIKIRTPPINTIHIILCLVFLYSCSLITPERKFNGLTTSSPPQISVDAITGEHSVEIDVLTYNVAALPWPIRRNRTAALQLIGQELAALRATGNEPDIILLQEGFRGSTRRLVQQSGYPNWVQGPSRRHRSERYSQRASPEFRNGRSFFKGERIGKIMNGGLHILSNFPITASEAVPFHRSECAGFDCGANKGVLWAQLDIPGVPQPIQFLTLHFNARNASGVSEARSLEAYDLQFNHSVEMTRRLVDPALPFVFGGDFNSKHSTDRLGAIMDATNGGSALVHTYCLQDTSGCDLNIGETGEQPWLETQDWQGWADGATVKMKPILVEHWFSEPHPDAPKIKGRTTLSDHDGLFVRYRLSWYP